MIKLINIASIGTLIITAVIFTKFKLVSTVFLDEQEIGYVENKQGFEKLIKENLYNNKEKNIAFADINAQIKYNYKLILKQEQTNESEILNIISENADITYYEYAINVDGVERKYLKTEEQAINVADNLKQELGEDANITISTKYTKELTIDENVEVATILSDIENDIAEEKKKEEATINGVYLSVAPITGHITSRYGAVESVRDHTHQGLDIAADTGTPIKATANGTVTFAGERGGYGNLLIIDHGNGIETYYGHCSKLYVKNGEEVSAGDVIAAVGNTGNSTGSHLHFEIRQNGVYVNPQKYLYK